MPQASCLPSPMLAQLLAIIRNTFFESIRQPITLVLLVAATLGLIFSNALSGYTMEDDQRMMIDMGLSTIFICGALLAAFIATNVLTREIENRTVLTIVSKPVGRPVFFLGKYLGVAAAMLLAALYMSFMFLLVELHGTMQTVRDPYHGPVWLFGVLTFVIAIGVGLWSNYFYGKVFASTAICVATPLLGLAYLLSLMFDHGFSPQSITTDFKPQLLLALGPLIMAILVLTAVAVTVSTRAGQVLTLIVTVLVLLAGLSADYFIGGEIREMQDLWLSRAVEEGLTETTEDVRYIHLVGLPPEEVVETVQRPTVPLTSMAAGSELMVYGSLWAAYALIPNAQVMWLSDALTQNHVIPAEYVARVLAYGGLEIIVILSLGVIMFQRREVG